MSTMSDREYQRIVDEMKRKRPHEGIVEDAADRAALEAETAKLRRQLVISDCNAMVSAAVLQNADKTIKTRAEGLTARAQRLTPAQCDHEMLLRVDANHKRVRKHECSLETAIAALEREITLAEAR